MSEYQYYEFQAVDLPLGAAEQAALRALSSRARITPTGFVNHYDWGSFKGDPSRLVERYFDLFLYLANWGTRRLSIRLPARLVDVRALARFCPDDEVADIRTMGAHAIIDISRDEIDPEDWDDGSGWMGALAPLRGDILHGDLRVFYLFWLMAVEDGHVDDEEPEPLAGIAPLSGPLRAFADFFVIDPDLLDAAAAEGAPPPPTETVHRTVERFIRSLPEEDKVALLLRLHDGEPHLGAELHQRLAATRRNPDIGGEQRSAGELRRTARRMAIERQRAAAEKAAATRRRREAEQAQERTRQLARLEERGEAPWREVEELISRGNRPGYDRAVTLMIDLGELARSRGNTGAFARRVADIGTRHERKRRLIERLDTAGLR